MHDEPAGADPVLGMLGDFRLLIILFASLRVMLMMVYQPYWLERYDAAGSPAPVERGLSTFGDFATYFQFAKLSADGQLPYRDYWYEFPPAWSALFVGLYRLLAVRGPVDYTGWATALGLLMVTADVGNLTLLRWLGRRLHGERTALAIAWAYALLAAPLIFPWWTFETLVALTILAALAALVNAQLGRFAVAVAVGALTKFIPLLLLPALWRFAPWRRAVRPSLIAVGLTGLGLALVVFWGGELGRASLTAQANKPSYQSVWALVDGNWRTGSFPGLEMRLDARSAYAPPGNGAVVPGGLRLLPFAALGLYIYTRPLRRDAQGIVAFASLTLVLFSLWAQGWSPQWSLTLTPLILLNFPSREGVLTCLLLGALAFAEYPVLFMRTGDTGGAVTGALVIPYVAVILMRTGLLIGLAVALYRRVRKETA